MSRPVSSNRDPSGASGLRRKRPEALVDFHSFYRRAIGRPGEPVAPHGIDGRPLDKRAKPVAYPTTLEGVSNLQISPDGCWIYFTERSSEGDIWIGRAVPDPLPAWVRCKSPAL